MRHLVFTAFVIGNEILVVIQCFVFPHNMTLFIMAVTSVGVMALMAAAVIVVSVVVLRHSPALPRPPLELR